MMGLSDQEKFWLYH